MSKDDFVYLTVEEVEDIHQDALDRDNGIPGREPGKLEAKLALVESGFGGYERFPSLEEKAAVYHYYLASGHCFYDANKRTSYVSAVTFLDYNGYDLLATSQEIFEWTTIIANHETRPEFKHAVKWIKDRMKPFE